MTRSRSGMTLMELLIASIIVLVVIVGISSIDSTRSRIETGLSESNMESSLQTMQAISRVNRALEQADRIRITAGCLLARVPLGTDFDNAGNYQWLRFRRNGTDFVMSDGSGADTVLFSNVTDAQFGHLGVADAPPGGDPVLQDNNVVSWWIEYTDPTVQPPLVDAFGSVVTLRAAAYSDVANGTASPGITFPEPSGC